MANKQIFKKGFRRLGPTSIARPFRNQEKIILRDYLAMQRTTLANERTLFSYIRTSLYLAIGGVGFMKVATLEDLIWLGYPALALSGGIAVYGIVRYLILRHRLKKFYREAGLDTRDKD